MAPQDKCVTEGKVVQVGVRVRQYRSHLPPNRCSRHQELHSGCLQLDPKKGRQRKHPRAAFEALLTASKNHNTSHRRPAGHTSPIDWRGYNRMPLRASLESFASITSELERDHDHRRAVFTWHICRSVLACLLHISMKDTPCSLFS